MIELMIGAMVVALWVKTVPEAIADMVTTFRASKAGAWDVIDKDRDRKAARSASRAEARRKAVAAIRARRNRQAGGDGTYRPGAAAYLGDVYHGLWEDQLEKRAAKRAARPPVGPDGKRPPVTRLDKAVDAKVGAQRAKTGYVGRVARALIDPVGEKRQPADVVGPDAAERDDRGARSTCPVCAATLTMVNGGWQHPHGSTCVLGYPLKSDDGPRTACPECGDTLTNRDGDWRHPAGSTCESAKAGADPEVTSSVVHDGSPTPERPAYEPDALDRVVEGLAAARARQRPAGMTSCGRCGVGSHIDALTPMTDGSNVQMWCGNCTQATEARPVTEREPGNTTDHTNNSAPIGGERCTRPACPGGPIIARRPWPGQPDPHLHTAPDLQDLKCETCGWLSTYLPKGLCGHCKAVPPQAENTSSSTSNGGTDMSTGTVDLVDYNTAVTEHERALEALREQLNQAIEFGLHLTGATAAVEQMDAGRGAITNSLGPLAEGMEGSRYGADSTQGSAEATTTLTAGSIAAVQENIEAAADQNNRWIDELNAAIEGVQASLQHIKSQYGEAAATVQETGIDGRALEEH